MKKKRFFQSKILIKRCFCLLVITKSVNDTFLWIFLRTFAQKFNPYMYKETILLCIVAVLLTGCENHPVSIQLAEIDSLISAENYDSAYHNVTKLNCHHLNNESKAHYYLRYTQTSFLTNHPLSSDSLINYSISFYEKNLDKEKLCDAYYYKALYLLSKEDYNHGIILSKKAYELAQQSMNYGQQYKISELIAYINRISGNYDMQLKYAKEAVDNALKTNRERWIAYAYNDLNEAYQYKGETDSAIIYADKSAMYINSFDSIFLPYVLNNIGYAYMDANPEKAKEYLTKSIKLKPLTRSLENLAYIYCKEGNEEKAYELWKNALYCDDDISVDKIIYHILQYNLSHKDLDGACELLYNIVTIKDSINTAMSDRSIKHIQQKYDEKVVSDRHEKEIMKWCIFALLLVIIVIFLIGYIRYKKYKSKITLKEQQLLINSYINEIGQLKEHDYNAQHQIEELKNRVSKHEEQVKKQKEASSLSQITIEDLESKIKDYAEQLEQLTRTGNIAYNQIDNLNGIIKDYKEQIDKLKQVDNASKIEISSLKGKIDEYLGQINNLETEHEEAERQIVDLNQKIKDLIDQESPRLAKGKLLYEQIQQNGTTVEWTNDDYKCFIDFYKATNFASYSKVVKKFSPKTAHNTFFLLLFEIGKNDKEVRQIMGITQEAIRSTRFRIQQHLKK